jgi:hypothetical protein
MITIASPRISPTEKFCSNCAQKDAAGVVRTKVLAGDNGHRSSLDQNTVIFSVRDFGGQQTLLAEV